MMTDAPSETPQEIVTAELLPPDEAIDQEDTNIPSKAPALELPASDTEILPKEATVPGNQREKESSLESPAEVVSIAEDAHFKAPDARTLVQPVGDMIIDLGGPDASTLAQGRDAAVEDDREKREVPVVPTADQKRKADDHVESSSETAPKRAQKQKRKDIWDVAKSMKYIKELKDNVALAVEDYEALVGTDFDSDNLPPVPRKLNSKPGAPLRLPESACANTKFAFQHIVAGLRSLQVLANAEGFNQQAFVQELKKALDGWECFFSSYFTPKIKKIISRLKDLYARHEGKSGQQSQGVPEVLSSRSKRVTELLEQHTIPLCEHIAEVRSKIEHIKLAGTRDMESLSTLEAEYTQSIRELEAQHAEKKEGLKLIKDRRSKNAVFFKEEKAATQVVDESFSQFEKIAAKGDAMNKRIEKHS